MSTNTTNALTIDAPEGQPFVITSREFDAPASAVFAANCDPELVTQWLSPNGYQMVIDVWEATNGGRYRYVHTDPEGNEYAFRGSFHSVEKDSSIIQTFEFEGFPGEVSLDKMTLTDLGDGRCRMDGQSTFASVEARDAIVASGMETGLRDGYDKLDALLAKKG